MTLYGQRLNGWNLPKHMQKKEIRSTTGELYWNYGHGYVTADNPRTQTAVEFLADVPVRLSDC